MKSSFFAAVSLVAVLLVAIAQTAIAVSILDFVMFGDTYVGIGSSVTVNGALVGSNGDVIVGDYSNTLGLRGGGSGVFGDNTAITGDVIFNGDIYYGDNIQVNGNIDAGGSFYTGLDNEITGNVTVGSDAWLDSDTEVIGDLGANGDVTMEPSSSVSGDVTHGGSLTPGANVASDSIGSVTPKVFPSVTLPTATVFSAGGSDQTDPGTLVSGTYGELLISNGQTLNLSAGNYFFDSITMGYSSTLNLHLTDGPINLFVVGPAYFDNIGVNLIGGGAEDVYSETYDEWVVYGGQWFGTILASNDITLDDNTELTGALYSRSNIFILDDVNANFVASNHLIPEPSTLILFSIGGLGILIYGIRRRKRAS